MNSSSLVHVAVQAALLLAAVGCGGPSDQLHHAVLDGTHARVQSAVSFGAGRGLIALAGLLLPDDGEIAKSGVHGVAVEVFTLEPGSPRPVVAALAVPGWQRVLRVKDGEDEVVILARARHGQIRQMALVALESEELTVVQLDGRLGEALTRALSGRMSPSEIVSTATD